jgi:hypothetical protein
VVVQVELTVSLQVILVFRVVPVVAVAVQMMPMSTRVVLAVPVLLIKVTPAAKDSATQVAVMV